MLPYLIFCAKKDIAIAQIRQLAKKIKISWLPVLLVESSGQVVQVIKTLFNALKDTDQIMTEVRRSKEKALRLKNLVQKSANDVIKATLRGSETQYRVVFQEKIILDIKMPKKMVLSFDLYNKTFTEDLKKVRDIIEKMTAIMDCDCHFNLKNYGNDVKWADSE